MASARQKGKQRANTEPQQAPAQPRPITPTWNPRYVSFCPYNKKAHSPYPYEPALDSLQTSLKRKCIPDPDPIDTYHLMLLVLEDLRDYVRPLLYTDIPDDARHFARTQWGLLNLIQEFDSLPNRVTGEEREVEKIMAEFKPAIAYEGLVRTFALDVIRAGMKYFDLLAERGQAGVAIPSGSSSLQAVHSRNRNRTAGRVSTAAASSSAAPSPGRKLELELALKVFQTGADAAVQTFRFSFFLHFDNARAMWANRIRVYDHLMMVMWEVKRQILQPNEGEKGKESENVEKPEEYPDDEDGSSDSWENVWFREDEGEANADHDASGDPSSAAESSRDAEPKTQVKKKGKKIKNAKLLKARARMGK
ncbi:hypothetical protein A1Q2_07102 [Trichosporon asahii var. asahii CBS 8904]|uniref:Uncharacterized protein n=1 Tax=Trichosporon asahii var. asahii (strain CBS 8904) TaxID=1220162 RepID=K1VCW7_TRIAC|nr:hypothetical protein A1Q2_07102 [Trichosporon asahii var. asahii CBS 8904]